MLGVSGAGLFNNMACKFLSSFVFGEPSVNSTATCAHSHLSSAVLGVSAIDCAWTSVCSCSVNVFYNAFDDLVA